MTSGEYLTIVYGAKEKGELLLQELKEIQDSLYSLNAIDYSKPRVSGGNGRNAAEDKIIELLDKRDKMISEYLAVVGLPLEFKELVEEMSDERMKIIMKRHYLFHETWEHACEGICSDSWLRRKDGLRAQALAEFNRIYEEKKISSC